MTIKLAINGFGRIGRNVLRALYENDYRKDMQVVAINACSDIATNAHLLKYDSTHGQFSHDVSAKENGLQVDQDFIQFYSQRDPINIPWKDCSVDIVLDCTGAFTTTEKAAGHLTAGAKKVLISAPGDKTMPTIVYGVNDDILKPTDLIVSNASCTTNCLAPIAKIMQEHFGIQSGLMTTVHAYTQDQSLLDAVHKDLRRARAAAHSLVPTKTGAAASVGLVIPALKGKLDGYAVRVPTMNVSLVDFTFEAEKPVTKEAVNAALKAAAQGELKGVMDYSELPLVSTDYNHTAVSATVDSLETRVVSNLVKVVAWYDNEWGFSNRMLDVAKKMAK